MSDEEKIGENNELIPFEVDENDDITEYITDGSFEALKKRFGTAEEDASIRNEEFNPLVSGAKVAKHQPDDDLRSSPSFKNDAALSETPKGIKSEFGSAESAFDNDAISFDEISLDLYGDLSKDDDEKDFDKSEEYNTNTRVIYVNEDAEDGIKRNTDLEVSDVFTAD